MHFTQDTTLSCTISGGQYQLFVTGNLGGGTITLYQSPGGSSATVASQSTNNTDGTATGIAISAACCPIILLGGGKLSAVMVGSTSPDCTLMGQAVQGSRAVDFI